MASIVECWVCGAEHEYCDVCGKTHGWKYVADTQEHYRIYMTIEEYRKGILSKEEAASRLSEYCNVNANDDLSWMLPNVEKGVREIIGDREVVSEKNNKTTKKIK